MIDQTSMYQTC